MDLKADSSFLAPLITLDSILIKSKRGISAYVTWTHTRTVFDGMSKSKNEARLLYCAYCSKESPYSNIIIINFRKYFKSNYQIDVEKEPNFNNYTIKQTP
jgi:hypothetical protein